MQTMKKDREKKNETKQGPEQKREANEAISQMGILDTRTTASCSQEETPFITTGEKSNRIFQMLMEHTP